MVNRGCLKLLLNKGYLSPICGIDDKCLIAGGSTDGTPTDQQKEGVLSPTIHWHCTTAAKRSLNRALVTLHLKRLVFFFAFKKQLDGETEVGWFFSHLISVPQCNRGATMGCNGDQGLDESYQACYGYMLIRPCKRIVTNQQ